MNLDYFFVGKIRLSLLTKLLINPVNAVYLRGLAKDLGVSSNTVRMELKKLYDMQLIQEQSEDKDTLMSTKTKYYFANTRHPLFNALRNIILQYVGLDQIMEQVLNKLGNVHKVYLIGDLAVGKNSLFVDLVFVGQLDKVYLSQLVEKAEKLIDKKIRFVVYHTDEFDLDIQRDLGVFMNLME
ncbi:MAG TPA: winged helix-turn-helix domain-containing protein [Sediminibacterium sp.]|uniref:winged helix-turn-helix domain-containing protein n=1 Tax=Sediminibacterium sp. TaxID=1917865 RepID=UPI002CEFC23A|nr:winged helix-turn-helix domain-containing protein [Sediminibacterium sp.]HQS36531.1 winged helix-turn-helix domain-containing protein [Sediminibacterium sp.]